MGTSCKNVEFHRISNVHLHYSTVENSTAQYSTPEHSTKQYSTLKHIRAQYSTALYKTVQNSTAQYSRSQQWCSQLSWRALVLWRRSMRTILEMGKFPTCSHWLMWTADNREGTNIISDKSHILTGDRWRISARDLPFMKKYLTILSKVQYIFSIFLETFIARLTSES